jgi:hypothetical protein
MAIDNPSVFPCSARGEAIPVDLGPKGYLFITLRGLPIRGARNSNPAMLHFLAFIPVARIGAHTYYDDLRTIGRQRPNGPLDNRFLPLLVRFEDLSDPKSVEAVDPAHMDQIYGPGARMVSATVAVTDDPVSTGIEKVLPWLIPPVPPGNWTIDITPGRPWRIPLFLAKDDFEEGVE